VVLPFGVVLELGNSAGAYCAVAQAQSSQVKVQEVDLHRAEYGTKWMLAQRGE
jgi:hypothetical protein